MKIYEVFDLEYIYKTGKTIKARYTGKIPQNIWDMLPSLRWGKSLWENNEEKMEKVKRIMGKRLKNDTGYEVEEIEYIEYAKFHGREEGFLDIVFIPKK